MSNFWCCALLPGNRLQVRHRRQPRSAALPAPRERSDLGVEARSPRPAGAAGGADDGENLAARVAAKKPLEN